MRPSGQLLQSIFSRVSAFTDLNARGVQRRSGKSHARSVSSACVTIETRPTGCKTALELILCAWLRKALRTFNKQSFHFVVDIISCRVQHAQFRPKLDGLACKITSAKDQSFQIDIGKECVDVLGGTQE